MENILVQLSEQIVAARAEKRHLVIRGGGTRLFHGEPLPPAGSFSWLDISPFKGVLSYEPSELVITARAGTTLAEIEELLHDNGQMLAFEPPRFGPAGTIGGCVATGMSGPRRMAAGPLSDFVLGTRMLDAGGQVLRFGGEVMKNVAGYDISRLLAGSHGILGLIAEVSIKLAPRPQAEASLVFEYDQEQALQACLQWRSRPLPVSATAWLPDNDSNSSGLLHVRLSGNEAAVRQAVAGLGGEAMPAEKADQWWLSIRDQTHGFFSRQPVWRLSLPAGTPALGFAGSELHELGGCLRWLAGDHDANLLRARVQALGGHAGLYLPGDGGLPGGVSFFHPPASGVLQLHRRLKHEFDPAGVFNPGRLVPGI